MSNPIEKSPANLAEANRRIEKLEGELRTWKSAASSASDTARAALARLEIMQPVLEAALKWWWGRGTTYNYGVDRTLVDAVNHYNKVKPS